MSKFVLDFIKLNTKRSNVSVEDWRKLRKIWQEMFESHKSSSFGHSNKQIAPLLKSNSRFNRSELFILSSLAFGTGLFHIYNEAYADSSAKFDDENKERRALSFNFDNQFFSSIKSTLNNQFKTFIYSNTLLAKEAEYSNEVIFQHFLLISATKFNKFSLKKKLRRAL
jgi:hypothetical protein